MTENKTFTLQPQFIIHQASCILVVLTQLLLATCLLVTNVLMGFDTFYLTGLDEHGMKIQRKAEELGMTPKEYLDPMAADVQELWKNWIFL